MEVNDVRRDHLQFAYNALCGAEERLRRADADPKLRSDLGDVRERLGFIAFPGAGETTEVQG